MSQVTIYNIVLDEFQHLPILRFVCAVCHRELDADYMRNFRSGDAHAICRDTDGNLHVTATLEYAP
jgi:hypothetical protein